MKIDILTLFPEMFAPLKASMMRRATEKALVDIDVTNIRDFADNPHLADDLVYGGGAGMVLKPEPIMAALRHLGYQTGDTVLVTAAAGSPFRQETAAKLAQAKRIFIIAGHYEGIDQRVVTLTQAEEYSIGDYILTGGELPAMVMTDSIVRLLDGVLGDATSLEEESFNEGLLEYPHYTRPPLYEGLAVPAALLSGNHQQIAAWRRQQSLRRTWQMRPDLIAKLPLTAEERNQTGTWERAGRARSRFYLALVHYPVLDPKGRTINTSVTNLDIHDIARLAATYGAAGYFIVQPGAEQKALTEELLAYWTTGHGSYVNPDRKEALSRVQVVDSLTDATTAIQRATGAAPRTVGTSAKIRPGMIDFAELRAKFCREENVYLLVFGTGHGLTDETLASLDYLLRPISGRSGYNHLAVRSAVAIVLDRLLGSE